MDGGPAGAKVAGTIKKGKGVPNAKATDTGLVKRFGFRLRYYRQAAKVASAMCATTVGRQTKKRKEGRQQRFGSSQ